MPDRPIFSAPGELQLPDRQPASLERLLLSAACSRLGCRDFRAAEGLPAGDLPDPIRDALAQRPDEPGPLLWLEPEVPDAFDHGVLGAALDHGLALATRVPAGDLADIPPELFAETVLYARLPRAGAAEVEPLLDLLHIGVPVVFYGPADGADGQVLERLGLAAVEPIDGPVSLDLGEEQVALAHEPETSAGGFAAVGLDVPGLVVQATARVGDATRVYACRLANAAWLRGTAPGEDGLDTSRWLLDLAGELGWTIAPAVADLPRRLAVWRSGNALRLAGHWPAGHELSLATPDGGPILTGATTMLKAGAASYSLSGWFSHECRVWVRQAGGEVSCRAEASGGVLVEGLEDAVVTVRPPRDRVEEAEIDGADLGIEDEARAALVLFGVSGELTVKW